MRTTLITIILFLSINQDFFAFKYFGEIAKTPIVFLCPFFIFYELLSIKDGSTLVTKYQKYFLLYYFIVIIMTIFYFIIIYLKYWELDFLGENIVLKSIKLAVYPLVYFLFYRFIINFLNNNSLNMMRMFNAIYINQLLLFIILLLEIPAIKDGTSIISFFHPPDYKYWRIRLLTMEASWAGPVALIFSLTPMFLLGIVEVKKRYKKMVLITSISFLLLFLVHNSSKGFIICFVFAVVVYIFRYIIKRGIKPVYIVSFILFSIIPLLNFQDQLIYIVENFGEKKTTTFGTRFISYLAGIKTFLMNPFGTGWGGLTSIYPNNIEYFVNIENLNTSEIKQYLLSTRALSTKTYFFDQLIFGGIFFLIFFYLFFAKRLVWIKNRMFENQYMIYSYIVLLCLILVGITYLTYHVKYEIWFFLAILDFIEYKEKKIKGKFQSI